MLHSFTAYENGLLLNPCFLTLHFCDLMVCHYYREPVALFRLGLPLVHPRYIITGPIFVVV